MHDDRVVIEKHIVRTVVQRLQPAQYRKSSNLDVYLWETPDHEPVPFSDATDEAKHKYEKVGQGRAWGRPWRTGWFKVVGTVPDAPGWQGQRLEVCFDPGYLPEHTGFGAEGLAYDVNGAPIKGMNRCTPWIPVPAGTPAGAVVRYYVEAAANPLIYPPVSPFGDFTVPDPYNQPLYTFQKAQLRIFDQVVWDLTHDVEVLQELMLELGLDSPRRWEILRALQRCADALDPQDVAGTAQQAREQLQDVLSRPAHASAHLISAVGHAHLDSAWMWPFRETRRKVLRTVGNAVSLMDEHPDYTFVMSQAQQLEWLKKDSPALFDRVKKKVEEKKFVPVGGMWVEADTNMPCGEALVRQFTYGKRFYAEEFDLDTKEVWLPDSFGYSGALPQIIALSGSKWLFTQKISWNETDVFPHHTFLWEGIDGTRVFTHATPANMYEARITGREVARVVRNFAEKGSATRSLLAYGYSDGGGGPTREHLGRARRLADLEGSARVSLESPEQFFEAAEADYPNPPVWYGEQYLERHRGTYTSQAKIKRGNRLCETLLREAELWCATAAVRVGFAYPYGDFDRIWKVVLLNQFHDVLPGSSIPWVHRDAVKSFEDAAQELRVIIGKAQKSLVGDGQKSIRFNPSPHPLYNVPALGASAQGALPVDTDVTQEGDDWVLENAHLRVVVDKNGLITSLHDKVANREVVPPGGRGNLLQLHQDTPVLWDAWDIESYYRNTVKDLTQVDKIEKSPTGKRLVITRSFGAGSKVHQLIWLNSEARRVRIDTTVTWKETEKLLKLSFPLDVQVERSASEIQFGHLFRPAHTNTSWDAARFEICAHRWLHVGEPGYGVALANRTTYGHDVTRHAREGGGTTTTVRASLLRASQWLDRNRDSGEHHFSHALVLGASIPDAVREGYRLNTTTEAIAGANDVPPLVSVDHDGVVVETVKLADDGQGDVVVRLYEAHGNHARCELKTSFALDSAHVTNLLETPALDLDVQATGDAVALEFRPFQVITVRLHRS
ncbi:alpha-mannosidase [Actinosynnema sp. NPDC059797]